MCRARSSTSGRGSLPSRKWSEATGGRVELQSVRWSLRRLEFELAGLVIHGKESAAEAPLLRAEHGAGAAEMGSAVARPTHRLHELSVRASAGARGRVQGWLDQCSQAEAGCRGKRADRIEQVLRLAMDHAELSDGLLQWNDEKIRLNGAANGVGVELGYRAGGRALRGHGEGGRGASAGCGIASR